jgi:hypothetical protein
MRQLLFLSIIVIALAATCSAQQPNSSGAWIPSKILGIVYPILARNSRLEGDVKVKCLIGENGFVKDVEILASPHALLSDCVKANLARWKFRHSGSVAHEDAAIITYSFRLSGTCEDSRFCKETEFWYEYPYHVIAIADHFPLRQK